MILAGIAAVLGALVLGTAAMFGPVAGLLAWVAGSFVAAPLVGAVLARAGRTYPPPPDRAPRTP